MPETTGILRISMTQHGFTAEDDNAPGSPEEETTTHVELVMRDTCVRPDFANLLPEHIEPHKPMKGVVWAEARVAVGVENNTPDLSVEEVIAFSRVNVIPVEIDNETMTTDTTQASCSTPPEEHPGTARGHVDMEGGYSNEYDDMSENMEAHSSCYSLYRWNCIVFVVGNSLLLGSLASSFGLEVAACTLYILGAVFFWAAEGFAALGSWTLLFQTLLRLLSNLFLSLDLLILTMSALFVEVLSWVAGILCCLFGGVLVGAGMQRYIGDCCQWAKEPFRTFHADWNPQRMQPFDFEKVSQDDSRED